MRGAGMQAEAFARAHPVLLFPCVQQDGAGKHITEFLALVGGHFLGLPLGPQFHQDGLHFIFLGTWNQPGDAAAQRFRILMGQDDAPPPEPPRQQLELG